MAKIAVIQGEYWTTMKNVPAEVDIEQCWIEQTISSKNILKVKESLHLKFIQKCMLDIKDSDKNQNLRLWTF